MRSVKSSDSPTPTPLLYKLSVTVDNKEFPMEIDTGSAVTLLSATDFSKLGDHIETLKSPTVILKSYTGNIIECLGEKEMKLEIGDQLDTLLVRVVKGPSILGRDLMAKFKLPWQNIFHMVSTTSEDIVSQYPNMFDNTTVGKLKGIQVPLRVKEANPVFIKPRVVPFAIRSKYEEALEKLVAEDIIEKVEHSEWASPTVPIVKPNGDLRICGDYSVTINKFSVMEQYPIPSLEELLSNLSGGTRFTKIGLSQAYHQLELTPESRKYTTINTHQGLYQYKRLTYGVTSAVSIFQRTIENVLKDLPGCCVRIDDILVSGGADEIHLDNLHRVLQRLQECGLKLNPNKFHFMLNQVVYLGTTISAEGISPTKERQLLCKETRWKWGKLEQEAFHNLKAALCSDSVLRHYDPTSKLILQCDASSVGVGATVLQRGPDDSLLPVAYASRTLTSAEQNYSQIERESLAIVFVVTKFRQYLLGRHFTLLTDHKPLITLMGEHKPVPQLASARIKRWSLLLAAYNYTIEFIPGKQNVYADFLSRRPIDADPSDEEQVTVNVMFIEGDQFVNASIVASETKRDSVLSKVLQFTQHGWPEKPEPVFQPYHNKRLELTQEDGILLWNSRVIVPEVLRTLLLKDLHAQHLGMVKMKQLARRYLWWPGLDKEIEETVKLCHSCQEAAKAPPAPNPASWSWPGGPWKRLHLDFAGPYLSKMFLVIVDGYSKFVEVVPMGQATTTNTIAALRRVFSYFGLPEHLVTDNGSQFTSAEFQNFLKENDIEHALTAPGHPATNGLSERYVGEFKDKLNKIGDTGETVQTKLDRFLLTHRATPTSLGKSPSELLMNRQPRIRFSALRFKTKTVSPRNFNVQVGDTLWKRHEEQLRPRLIPADQCIDREVEQQKSDVLGSSQTLLDDVPTSTPYLNTPIETEWENITSIPNASTLKSVPEVVEKVPDSAPPPSSPNPPKPKKEERRYPLRDRKPPERFY
ncbi:PREDICTED: uncharacterized protein K02A2.6-like [Acropora digitifera]|uniref:uncharacterized protein K02A2.6-like n=1 Tax=Acropora digitifera TaxID=70779 RepID=UPI00077ADF78|nr:PREDICTED: uncharacterized protein K02A2.6-like [Acropora digitifera]